MKRYIHERDDWPHFRWKLESLAVPLVAARHRHGLLMGRVLALTTDGRQEAALEAMTEEVQQSSAIEGELLDRDSVRSSIARRLGMESGVIVAPDRNVEGVVEMTLDAIQNCREALTAERIWDWHAALFPTGRSGMRRIIVGGWRDDRAAPMQVVSGPIGKERVHYEAPAANRLPQEMDRFLEWFNAPHPAPTVDPVLRTALAHLWFVTIHPLEDGNGRIARAISDMILARFEGERQRFVSMSAQIHRERGDYYSTIERTQKGDLDITPWMSWFIGCFDRALQRADSVIERVLAKARFWDSLAHTPINERQRKVLNLLLDGFQGKLTTEKWAKITKTSHDTALRDIQGLLAHGVLTKDAAGGRSTSYSLVEAGPG